MYDNTGWTVTTTAAECTSGDSESWDAIISYRHDDGRWIEEVYGFTLMGEVMVEGERFTGDPFLSSVDDAYTDALDAHGDDQSVERNYFLVDHSHVHYAGVGDDALDSTAYEYPDRVESHINSVTDLAYDGPVDSADLDDAAEAHLTEWARGWAEATLRFNDMDDMHRLITEG